MAVELEYSAIGETVRRITATPGSPYYILSAVIHAGGKDIYPLQFLSHSIGRDFVASHTDDMSLVLAVGLGTLINEIGPFQDDLKITINRSQCDGEGRQLTNLPVVSRTYRAYLGDDIPRASEAGNNPAMQDTETANRTSIRPTRFIVEEVAMEQLRKMQVGITARSCPPYAVMQTLLVKSCQALKLGNDEVITGFDMVEPNNTTARDHVVVRDGTPVLDLPDLLQNKQGGIYSTGLGFYIQGRSIYTWPLYDTGRQDTAKRLLQVVLAPSKQSRMLDRTWLDNGRMVTVYSAGVSKVIDDTLGKLNVEGNGVRFADASKLLDGFGEVKGNKLTVSRSKNNNEYVSTVLGNGQNFAPLSDSAATSNVYLEASKLAKRSVAIMILPWRRSNPELLVPGMTAEILYDYNGIIRTIEGVLLGNNNDYTLDGQGVTVDRYIATTSLIVGIDRNDPDYIDYLKNGGAVSPSPEIGSL